MIIKIKEHFSKLSPLNILVYIFSIGLIYGGFSLFMKYQAYLEYMSTTQAIAVKVRPVTLGKAENTYRALSTIKSNKSIDINSKVNGIIDGIYFIEGAFINKNQKLYSIISSDKIGITEIYAPFDGLVGLSSLSVGENVNKGMFLTSLDDSSVMKLNLNLPEKLLPFLSSEINFRASSDKLIGKIFSGKIEFIDTRIDKNTRTIKAYALIENENLVLKPGLLMKVDLILEKIDDAILIPEEALLSIDGKHYVYIKSDESAKIKSIEIGIRDTGKIQVISGLSKDDVVIYMGQEKLKDNSLITVVK